MQRRIQGKNFSICLNHRAYKQDEVHVRLMRMPVSYSCALLFVPAASLVQRIEAMVLNGTSVLEEQAELVLPLYRHKCLILYLE
jgi:hypothetical protein